MRVYQIATLVVIVTLLIFALILAKDAGIRILAFKKFWRAIVEKTKGFPGFDGIRKDEAGTRPFCAPVIRYCEFGDLESWGRGEWKTAFVETRKAFKLGRKPYCTLIFENPTVSGYQGVLKAGRWKGKNVIVYTNKSQGGQTEYAMEDGRFREMNAGDKVVMTPGTVHRFWFGSAKIEIEVPKDERCMECEGDTGTKVW